MKYRIERTTKFKKEYKRAVKQGLDVSELEHVIKFLANGERLPEEYLDHKLKGNYAGYRECHVSPDWLLVYKQEADMLILTLVRTGTHSDLYGK